jgi:predicted NBD/HSP70 family sugar kinase
MTLLQRGDKVRVMGDSGMKQAPDAPSAIATDSLDLAFERVGRIRQPLLSSSRVGSTNKGLVIQALFDLGPTSRAALARIADVNRTTISGIVQPLIDAGWLVEGNPIRAARAGGKPAKPLWFSPDAQPLCGVLLMPEAVHACVVTLDGHILTEAQMPLPDGHGPVEPMIDVIANCISTALSRSGRPPAGMGVAIGGMVDTDDGTIVQINLAPALDGYPLARELGDRFRLPVRIDHHPRALLVGDRWFGKGRGLPRFAVIYTGEVLGGAFLIDGHLYRGASGAGGELGHSFVQLDGELCRCGRRGCWDTVATLGWLRREASKAGLPDWHSMNSARLSDLIANEVRGAHALRDRYARNVAVGIANLQQTLALNHFILHGDVVSGGEGMISAIAHHVQQLVPARPGGSIVIVAGDATDRAALLGAAGLALSDLVQFSL